MPPRTRQLTANDQILRQLRDINNRLTNIENSQVEIKTAIHFRMYIRYCIIPKFKNITNFFFRGISILRKNKELHLT